MNSGLVFSQAMVGLSFFLLKYWKIETSEFSIKLLRRWRLMNVNETRRGFLGHLSFVVGEEWERSPIDAETWMNSWQRESERVRAPLWAPHGQFTGVVRSPLSIRIERHEACQRGKESLSLSLCVSFSPCRRSLGRRARKMRRGELLVMWLYRRGKGGWWNWSSLAFGAKASVAYYTHQTLLVLPSLSFSTKRSTIEKDENDVLDVTIKLE